MEVETETEEPTSLVGAGQAEDAPSLAEDVGQDESDPDGDTFDAKFDEKKLERGGFASSETESGGDDEETTEGHMDINGETTSEWVSSVYKDEATDFDHASETSGADEVLGGDLDELEFPNSRKMTSCWRIPRAKKRRRLARRLVYGLRARYESHSQLQPRKQTPNMTLRSRN